MALSRAVFTLERTRRLLGPGEVWTMKKVSESTEVCHRHGTSTKTGAILPEPQKAPFGIVGVVCGIAIGLFIGATISKYMANFLEENELFVPSDDDDDDDDD